MIQIASPAFQGSRVLGGSALMAFWVTIAILGCVPIAPKVLVVFALTAGPFRSFRRPPASPPFPTLARMQAPASSRTRMARATFIARNIGN